MSINFDRMREIATETTEARTRRWWDGLKLIGPVGGVSTTVATVRKNPRKKRVHIPGCMHTMKHHRKGGGCRKGCGCMAGVRE